jgi:putative transposase
VFAPKQILNPANESIGIDFGCENQLTLSNGEKIKYSVPVNKRIKILDKKLARQRRQAGLGKQAKRKKKGEKTETEKTTEEEKSRYSKNHIKTLKMRQQEYQKLTNKRNEQKNQIVNRLVKSYRTICFQDESLAAWAQSGHGKKIQFSAIGGIISGLQRKAVTPIVVDKYYPSTQLCSMPDCDNKQDMPLDCRVYICQSCKNEIDRDINSAISIEKEGLKQLDLILAERKDFKPMEMGPLDIWRKPDVQVRYL